MGEPKIGMAVATKSFAGREPLTDERGSVAGGRLGEFAEEVHAVFDFVVALLHGEEFRVDVRAVRYRREDFVPAGVFLTTPDVVEKARRAASSTMNTLAVGRRLVSVVWATAKIWLPFSSFNEN